MAITDSNSFDLMIATAVAMGLNKTTYSTKGTGAYHSLWKTAGSGGVGVNPPTGVGAICDKNTAGALPLLSVTSPTKLYLSNLSVASGSVGVLFLFDRLWANSGLSGISTITQPVNAPALPRVTTGEGLLLFVEIYTATGTAAQTLTVTYTNSDGVAGRTATASLIATPVAGQIIPIFLPDKGLSLTAPIQSVILSGTTGAQGDFGLTIVKQVSALPLFANSLSSLGSYDLPTLELDPNTCLSLNTLSSSTTMLPISGTYSLGRG
jgi:hypothetical protein